MAFLLSIRPANLLIIGCTQILIYFLFFHSIDIANFSSKWVLSPPKIYLFSLVTICIAASGYIINDYVDFHSDIKNKKRNGFPNRYSNLKYYLGIILIGFIISVWFASQMDNPLLAIIYLLAVAGLFVYSTHLKKTVLFGNVTVSLFSSGVLWILLFAEDNLLNELPIEKEKHIREAVWLFCIFAFLVSMVREIVKDVEDINGDHANGYNTLPIRYGVQSSKYIALAFVVVLISSLSFMTYTYIQEQNIIVAAYLILATLLPSIVIGYMICLPGLRLRARLISQYCKVLMLFGIVLLILVR